MSSPTCVSSGSGVNRREVLRCLQGLSGKGPATRAALSRAVQVVDTGTLCVGWLAFRSAGGATEKHASTARCHRCGDAFAGPVVRKRFRTGRQHHVSIARHSARARPGVATRTQGEAANAGAKASRTGPASGQDGWRPGAGWRLLLHATTGLGPAHRNGFCRH